jgi:two-component system sensor histidine kinase/response regulator
VTDECTHLDQIDLGAGARAEGCEECLAAGMNDFISKPIDPANLFETVAKFYKASVAAPSLAPNEGEGRGEEANASPGALPRIEGLDTADGLARVGGNQKLYLKLLRQFVAQQGEAAVQIAQFLQAGDHAAAERMAHTVKGVAGNLGAKSIHTTAAELEKLIREKAGANVIETGRQKLVQQLVALVSQLRPGLGEESSANVVAPAVVVDPAQIKSVVEETLKQLSEFDAAVGDSFEGERAVFAAVFSEAEMARFGELLQNYDFAGAQTMLESAAKKISTT